MKIIKNIQDDSECDNYIEYVKGRVLDDKRYKIYSTQIMELGWKQLVDFDEGLKKTVDWYSSRLDYWGDAEYALEPHPTPHTADATQTWLKSKFSKKFVDKKMWPPRSPDLNPCNFYLWGHLKSVVYNPLPKTLDDLKANIRREIKKIPKDVLNSVFFNLEKRCKSNLEKNGGHIEA